MKEAAGWRPLFVRSLLVIACTHPGRAALQSSCVESPQWPAEFFNDTSWRQLISADDDN
jgi:hypothetical protein